MNDASAPGLYECEQEQCAACGRFLPLEQGPNPGEAWMDVEPGGVRGTSYCAYYCDEACSGKVQCAHGVALTASCGQGCE